ncbi:MAG: hypothetical protein JWO91_74, partial [Acidobacteriaceae bacterium]|nr:hypothetical protein [Acidobacteriaceae bacterium]
GFEQFESNARKRFLFSRMTMKNIVRDIGIARQIGKYSS